MQVGVPGAEPPRARAAQEVGEVEGGDGAHTLRAWWPAGALGHKTVPLSSPCPSWMSSHRLRDCSSGQTLAKLALLVPTGGWGLWFGGAADGSAAQDREGGGAQTQHSPPTSFPPSAGSSWLCAPPSSCLSTTSSGMSSSSSSAMRIPGEIVPLWRDREGHRGRLGWIRSPLLPGICVVAMETLPVSTYTDGHMVIQACWAPLHARPRRHGYLVGALM